MNNFSYHAVAATLSLFLTGFFIMMIVSVSHGISMDEQKLEMRRQCFEQTSNPACYQSNGTQIKVNE